MVREWIARNPSQVICVLITLFFLSVAFFRWQMPIFEVSSDPLLRQVDSTGYISLFSTRQARHPSDILGYWSLINTESNELKVIPAKVSPNLAALSVTGAQVSYRLSSTSTDWYSAGYLEGVVTSFYINQYYDDLLEYYEKTSLILQQITGNRAIPFAHMKNFFIDQAKIITEIRSSLQNKNKGKSLDSAKWNATKGFQNGIEHLFGIVDGFSHISKIESNKLKKLELSDFLFLNSFMELHEIASFIGNYSFGHIDKTAQATKSTGFKESVMIHFILTKFASASFVQPLVNDNILNNNIEEDENKNSNNHNNEVRKTRIAWNHHIWTEPHLSPRFFHRFNIKSQNISGSQYVSFPGQISSLDSFSMLVKPERISVSAMKLYLTSTPSPSISPSSNTFIFPSWLLLSLLSHTHHDTSTNIADQLSQFKAIEWTSSPFPPQLLSNWKLLIVDRQISEVVILNQNEGAAIQRFDLTSKFMQDKFYLAFASKSPDSNLASSAYLNIFDEAAIRIARKRTERDLANVLRLSVSGAAESALLEIRSRFKLDFYRLEELLELSPISSE